MGVEAQSTSETIQILYKGGSFLMHTGVKGAKNTAVFAAYLQARLKAASENKVSGELELAKLNKDGQPITCYELRYEDFQTIKKDAKEYGFVYSVIYDKKYPEADDAVTLFIRQIDAVKLERILDKHKIATIEPDVSGIQLDYDKDSNVIHAQVDLGEARVKPKNTAAYADKEDDNPLSVAPSENKLNGSNRKRKSVRAELAKAEELVAKENSLTTKNMDSQLEEEFSIIKEKEGIKF